MFGYLNKGNPRLIGETEAQEIKNASIEKGYLAYSEYETNALNNIKDILPNGKIVQIDVDDILGQVKWKSTEAGSLAQFGLDQPDEIITNLITGATTSKIPTVAAGAYSSNPYIAGAYEHAVTLYDPDTEEESAPYIVETTTVDHSTPGSEVVQFTDFPDVSSYFPGRTNLQWRIYRRPKGGSEFLLVNGATTISANSDYAGPYQDIIEDQNLGDACDSIYDYVEPIRSLYGCSIILFNDHLFVFRSFTNYARINFSRQGKWWAFPTENEINFPGRFMSASVLNENLILFGSEGVHILYGDNIDNFQLKQVEFDLTENDDISVELRTSRATGGLAMFGVTKTMTLGSEEGTAVVQICAFDGARIRSISEKIKDIFPLADYSTQTTMETAIIDNRFYAIKLIDFYATLAAIEADGRTQAEGTPADFVYLTLVFDTYFAGWQTADDSGVFTYRTKEFALPRQVQFHKRIWVEAEGTFTLQFMGDNSVVTELTLTHATKTKAYYNIRPYRYDSFSFRFIGNQDCKIYDFGVDE